MFDPSISISQQSGTTEVIVEASPVSVPIVYKSNFWKDLPKSITDEYKAIDGQLKDGVFSGFSRIPIPTPADPLVRNLTLKFLRAANKFLRTPLAVRVSFRKHAHTANHALAPSTTPHKSMVADRMVVD